MNDDQQRELISAALRAREQAYAPYSKYPVGAALLSDDGRIFAGCNVENASFGLSICAERIAVGNAVTQAATAYLALSVATAGGGLPCGACRQVLSEFCDGSLDLLIVDADQPDHPQRFNLADLYPQPFRL
jgi:cytidine deaminase